MLNKIKYNYMEDKIEYEENNSEDNYNEQEWNNEVDNKKK